jgi:hypothetical protein
MMATKIFIPQPRVYVARATVNGERRVGYYWEQEGQHHFYIEGRLMSPPEHWVLPLEAIEIGDEYVNPMSPSYFKD